MAKVEIVTSLVLEIKATFNRPEANKILDMMRELEASPHKGKLLTSVGGIIIKEIKYKNFRFYFITDGYRLKFMSAEGLADLLLRFVRMSDKKHQQKTINEIRKVLQEIGPAGLK